ncbi:IS607 family transposase [Microcoleus sp. LEGE 07076]|uniref:IS607 family transposase n=1 Tax=Microcoleus sp. LEGE 07076 TaxID=915322 RepID=UPI001882AB45|nr:IS607 family transposase [Microcoleus sp. LEGE 07076]MBE9187986.1 IS607 family transposase [Microcoleus sp. LEGE 07076]
MNRLISIGELAELKAVSVDTIRRWEKEGKLESVRTDGGHRRYRLSDFVEQKIGKTIAYARVSSHDQKADLDRQDAVLSGYCQSFNWEYEVIRDLGSGMNYRKKGLTKLISTILDGEVARLVITHKDRLLRFGSELIFSLCEYHEVEVVILNKKEDATFEEDLASDVLEIITVFSARLYGSRSSKNKKLIQKLAESVQSG